MFGHLYQTVWSELLVHSVYGAVMLDASVRETLVFEMIYLL